MLNLDYSSSDDQEDETRSPSPPRPAKRRKLPPLGGSFVDEALPEDPSKHQGRTLARAKVIGDYPTHLYLSFDVPFCFRALVKHARSLVPELHSLIDRPTASSPPPSSDSPRPDTSSKALSWLALHVSLSRPLYVRKEQRPKLEADLRDAVHQTPAFAISFSTLRVLRNDEQTRLFLGVDVAAGYPELTALTDRLNAVLRHHHLPVYYDSPIFHTSVAWALLRPPDGDASKATAESEKKGTPSVPSIEDLPADVLKVLQTNCGPIRKLGGLAVDGVRMKYGAEEIELPLGDAS